MRPTFRLVTAALGGIAALGLATAAIAQNGPSVTDTRTGKVWSPEIIPLNDPRSGPIDPAVDKAFEHLRAGLAGRSDLVKLAQDDSDLDALRGDPRFDELVGTPTPG